MSVLSYNSLLKEYPEVDEEQRTSNGIDLRIGALYKISDDLQTVAILSDKKMHVKAEKVNWSEVTIDGQFYNKILTMEPKTLYRVVVKDDTHIPLNMLENYWLRSTFANNGIFMSAGVGDSGYEGNLQFMLENRLNVPVYTEEGIRFAQMVMHELDNISEKGYDGSYQNNQDMRGNK